MAICQKTALSKGYRYIRTADLYTDPGGDAAVIDQIAAALPSAENVVRSTPTADGISALTSMRATPAGFHADTVTCSRGNIVTLDAVSQPTDTYDLTKRVVAFVPAGARQFSSPRTGSLGATTIVGTIVASSDDVRLH